MVVMKLDAWLIQRAIGNPDRLIRAAVNSDRLIQMAVRHYSVAMYPQIKQDAPGSPARPPGFPCAKLPSKLYRTVLRDAPSRTEVVDSDGVIKDPTGYIIQKKPSDKMSNAAIRAKLLEWQLETSGSVLCLGCGEYLKARHFHVDHIDPKSQGGSNRIDNRILLCGACNGEKGNSETLLALMNRHINGRQERKAMQNRLLQIRKLARAYVDEIDKDYVRP